jgi:integrase
VNARYSRRLTPPAETAYSEPVVICMFYELEAGVDAGRGRRPNGRWQDRVCSARTKGQAAEMLRDIQVAEDRARHGLEARPPADGGGTVDELIEWWAEKSLKRKVSYGPCIGTIRKHLVGSRLGGLRLVEVTAGDIEALLEEKSRDLAAETLNHLRGYVGRAFTMARRAKRFVGASPIGNVPKRKAPRRLPDFLRPDEAVAVLDKLPPKWKCLFATAIYSGMRKGELLALRKVDVDLTTPKRREPSATYLGAGYRVRTDDNQLGQTTTAVSARNG